jgi:hypothetical protein
MQGGGDAEWRRCRMGEMQGGGKPHPYILAT